MPDTTGQYLSEDMLACIQLCVDCHKACTETSTYCMQMGGPHSEPSHLRLLLDCAEICQTSANFMMRGSDLHHFTCGACGEICDRCAQDCEHVHDGDPSDTRMAACAAVCRRCAESCRNMAHAMAH
jgi:hypothetical protein